MRRLRQTRLELLRRLTASASATALLLASTAQAAPLLPSGGAVTAGTAAITQPAPGNALIVQQSQKAIINWQNFSIGAGASVTFQQPNASAITLNRVVGPEASAINGSLSANGQVWLLNGNGILFGKGSSINVGGLIATTSDIKDGDFLSGNYAFSGGSANPNAAVVNQGSIKAATGGAVVLSGSRVANDGVIQARLGKVVLGGASAFSVDFDGDNLIRYQVAAPVSTTPNGPDGKPAAALVSNSGTIAAAGGTVMMTARAARNVVDNVINSSGIIEAKSASVQNGAVILDAGDGGTVRVAGSIDASGAKTGQTGGAITLIGGTVAVVDGAKLNASGDAGGGTVLVGGNLHGAGPLPNAQTVSVGSAVIAADATGNGNGGTVAITSTGQTSVAATISAKGGAVGGDGGTVETSGADLDITGVRVDASAAIGASGLWLLDPTNFTIDSAKAATFVNELQNQHTDVLVQTDPGGSINVNAPMIYSSANSFTLLADGSLTFNASVQNSGAGAIFGVAGWDHTTAAANILTTPGAYGLNNGTVVIGTGSASGGVAVGSQAGATTIAGYDLAVVASSGYAQLGYHGSAVSGTATGAITIDMTADLILAGGSNGSGKYAQIGHGNNQSSNDSNAPISIMAAGNVSMGAGSGSGAYVLIGNGGFGGGGSQSGNITVSAGANVATAGGSSSIAQIGNSGSVITGSVLLTSVGDITLGAGSVLSAHAAGDSLVIAAGDDLINQAGTGAFNVTAGRWLAFLNDPSNNTTGLSAQPYYNRVFNFQTDTYAAVTSAGNRFVYALAPVLTVTIDNKSRAYGAANPTFTAAISAGLPGDAPSGVYTGAPALSTSATPNSNVGDYAITGALGTLVSDFNYAFQFVSGNLHINPAALTASLTGTVQKVYDGTLTATPGAANYQFTGLAAGDSVTLNDPLGTYDSKDVGSGKTVTVSGLALTSANKNNYVLNSTQVSGNVGIISAATLTASLTGTVQKTYNGNTSATLTAGNYQLSGVISEDSVTLNNPLGTYDNKNVGSQKTVSVSGLALQGADKGDYVLASTSISGAVGEIDAATLTASLTGTVQKTYDGNTGATLAADNYQLSGVVSEDNVTLNNPSSGTYDTKNVGSEKTVSVGGLALVGSDKGNYVLASTSIFGAVGEIDAATLTASLTGTVQKTYDGNTGATLTADNYQLSGVVSEDSVTLNNPSSGTYDNKNVGSEKTISVGGLALQGADKNNYVLDSTSISGAVGEIDAATLTASLTGTVQKTYDGNTGATLTADNYQLSGVVSEDSVTLNNPSSGTYDNKNVGSEKTISVGGLALQGADKNNYVLDSTSIFGAVGEIDAATLTASLTGTVQKTYDGNTGATLTADNYQLSGVVSEDSVTLNNPSSGTYDNKNVGSEKTISVGGLALQGADKNNYVLESTSIFGAVGEIDAATLTASLTGTVQKTYDGNTSATLTASNYQLSGVVSEDSVTLNNPSSGTYDNKNVGSEKTISVGGLALQGADKNNYVLDSTSISGAVGEIDAATLTASLTGTVQKTYDGNTGATLTADNYQLSGVVFEDNVTLNNPVAGLYDTKNVGSEKTVSVGGLALGGAGKGNYVLASTSISGAVGEIDAATLTASLTGTVQKPYDGNASATLAAGNYQLAGVVSGDSVTLNNPAGGVYDTPDAGTGKTVSVGGLALLGPDKNNYVLASSNISANIGVIGAITLTASLTGTVQKTYDGTTAASLSAENYQLAGMVSGDSVTLNDPSSGLYDNKNAGSGKTVSVIGLALQGADKNNYVLASTSIAGAVGEIDAATLTASLTGTVQKTYDGTTAAALAAGNYHLSGVISEDNVTLNNPASGIYDTKNVGSEKTVSVGGLTLQGADKGNYVLAASNISAAIGSITAATLTASLTGAVQKTYDGSTGATLAASNYRLSGVVSEDSVSLNNPAAGTFDTKNVGSGKIVSVSGVTLQGADKGNYVLASSSISGAIGTVTAATLTASLTGTVQKTYDGGTGATLAANNYQLSGVVSEDSVSLNNPAAGTFDTKNVGSGKTVSVSGVALQGADKGNYVLASSSISGAIGTITAATLTASLTGTVQKVYDGTVSAVLATANYLLAGAASGDSVSLNNPAAGTFDSKNVGSGKTVSVSGLALQGADKGNYVLASSSISGAIGTITAATLTASLTGAVQKTYDGGTSATLAANNYQLSGVVSEDSVSLNNPASGSYDTKNVGSGKTVSVSGVTLQGADKGNYVLASSNISAAIGTITAATLTAALTGTVQKTYDGTTTATLAPGNFQLAGVDSGDNVSLSAPAGGNYDSKNVGSGKMVSVSGLALQGADKGNYVLVSSNLSAAIGSINAATLTASLTSTVQKVYDGTVAAILSAANYLLSGVLAGDNISLNNPTSGSFASPDAGTGKTVTVSGLTLQGTGQANYVLSSSTISGPIGTITGGQVTPDVVQILGNTFTSGTVSGPQSPVAPPPPPAAPPPSNTGGGQTSSDATYATASAGDAPSDAAASKVGQSLSGAPGTVPSSTYVVIQGLLRQFQPPPGGARPHGVPPFGQVYSSWGNEAFWQ